VTDTVSASVPVSAGVHAAGAEPRLDHERLDVWRVALALDALVAEVARASGRGHAWLCDQALRASGSAALNLAEALGRDGADRARHLRIARGSALETDAALALLSHRGAVSTARRAQAHALAVRLVAMLTRLAAIAAR
jgi:four helix bundle protein